MKRPRCSLRFLLLEVFLVAAGLGSWRIGQSTDDYGPLLGMMVAILFVCGAIGGLLGPKGMAAGALTGLVLGCIEFWIVWVQAAR